MIIFPKTKGRFKAVFNGLTFIARTRAGIFRAVDLHVHQNLGAAANG